MTRTTLAISSIALSVSFLTTNSQAEEVHLGAVATTVNTKKASRLQGAYFGGFAGGAILGGADYEKNLSGRGLDATDEGGWLAGIEFGYSFQTSLPVRPAVEVEAFYLSSSVDADGSGSNQLRSDVRAAVVSVNGILALDLDDYAEDIGPFWASFQPYIGAGVGLAYAGQSNSNLTRSNGRNRRLSEESDITLAYQWFAGLEIAMTDTFSVYGEYKHLVLNELSNGAISDAQFDLWTLGFKVQY